jgi:hypothetical protein
MADSEDTPTAEDEAFAALNLAIIGGDYDMHLSDLAKAVGIRAMVGNVASKWKMKLGALELTEDELTFEEVAEWSKAAGVSWTELRPLSADINLCRTLLLVLLETRLGLTGEPALDQLRTYRAAEVVDAFSAYEVELSPLVDGGGN